MDVGSPIPFQGTESFPYMLYVKQAVTSMLFWNFHVKSIGMGTPTMYSEGCLQKPWVYRHSWFTLCEFQVSRWCTAKVNLLTNIFLCKKDCSPRALSLHSCSSYCWRASKRCHTSPHPHPLIKALYMSKIQFSGIQKHFFFFSFFFFFFGGAGGMAISPIHQVWAKPSCKAQWKGEEDKADRGRGGKTTSGNGRAWSSAGPRLQWRTGKNWENWLQNHQWCPNDPRG